MRTKLFKSAWKPTLSICPVKKLFEYYKQGYLEIGEQWKFCYLKDANRYLFQTEAGWNARIGRLKNQTEGGEEGNGEQRRVTKLEETRGRAR